MKQMRVLKPDTKKTEIAESDGFFSQIAFRFLPFWPLFVVLVVVFAIAGYLYLEYTAPIYETSAAILIKDEKKGADDSKMAQSFNLFGTSNIVENEIEIIRSMSVLTAVVKDLKLYAPISEEKGLFTYSAYQSSPIVIESQNPDSLYFVPKIYLDFSPSDATVTINNQKYALNQWVNTQWGRMRFTSNPYYQEKKEPVKLFFSLIPVSDIAKGLSAAIVVAPVSKVSTVVDLKLKDAVPVRAEKILNDVIKNYISISVQDKNSMAAKTLDFVEDRLKSVSGELQTIEAGVQKFRDQKNVVDISQQSRQYLDNVQKNDEDLGKVGLQLSALDQVKSYVESKNGQSGILVPSTLGVSDAQLSQLLEKLSAAQVQYEKLRKTVGEGHPMLVSVQNEIDKLRPTILENINSQRQMLESQKTSLTNNTSKYSSMLSSVPQKERELVQVTRDQSIKNSVYEFLLHKKEEAAFSVNSAVSDSRVIDKATTASVPVSPNKPVILFAFPFVGLVLGAGIVSLKGAAKGKILFRSEIEKLTSFPVVGELSFDDSKNRNPLIMAAAGRNFIMEQFRQLRVAVALGYLGNLPNGNRIVVTSSVEGEGKSFVAANLAISLALAGKKVALIDLDLHQPKISELFNIENEFGITEYLLGTKEADQIIKKMPMISHNLSIISSGTLPPNPSEFILNEKIEKLFNYLNKSFDVLIMDTPPVVPVSDTYVIAQYCSGMLYVVRHNYTPKVHIKMLEGNMMQNNVKNVGIVFNGVKKRGFGNLGYGHGYGYGYGYNSGYGYGHKGKDKKKII